MSPLTDAVMVKKFNDYSVAQCDSDIKTTNSGFNAV
jgi:hypothetical protein